MSGFWTDTVGCTQTSAAAAAPMAPPFDRVVAGGAAGVQQGKFADGVQLGDTITLLRIALAYVPTDTPFDPYQTNVFVSAPPPAWFPIEYGSALATTFAVSAEYGPGGDIVAVSQGQVPTPINAQVTDSVALSETLTWTDPQYGTAAYYPPDGVDFFDLAMFAQIPSPGPYSFYIEVDAGDPAGHYFGWLSTIIAPPQ